MKLKIYSLLMITFLFIASGLTVVNADIISTSKPEININKTIKVNKTYGVKKFLKSKGKKASDYSFRSNRSKIANVSQNGIITGKKAGKAVITVTSKSTGEIYAKINVNIKNRYTESDLRLLSSIIYSEAGNQVYSGKKAVGIVVMNRVKSPKFPNSIKGVIYQSGQFTPARNGSLSRALTLYDSGKLNADCIKAAKEVLNGSRTVTYNKKNINMNSYLYFSGYVAGCRLQIQGHQFK